jgi:hypothetical protein
MYLTHLGIPQENLFLFCKKIKLPKPEQYKTNF